jgi:predicted DNA-binding transcriptional regulator YafY
LQDEQWHPEQKITVHKDGSLTLEVPYSDERELLADVLAFGSDVKVLGPKSFREKLISSLKETQIVYEKEDGE